MITEIPPRKQAYSELLPLTTVLYEVFPEVASGFVIPYFTNRGRSIDQSLVTDMLRYEVKCRLKEQGIDVYQDDEDSSDRVLPEVDLNWLPNNGIEGMFQGWCFKLLRSRNDEVPSPCGSDRRKLFYAQQLPLGGRGSQNALQNRPNLVILWNFDASYRQVHIRIAVPKEAAGDFGAVKCYYNFSVPDPVLEVSQYPVDEAFVEELEVTWKESGQAEFGAQLEITTYRTP